MQSQLTRPAVGLNSYTPANAINENYMSDMIDVEPYREEAIRFKYNTDVPLYYSLVTKDQGRPIAVFQLTNAVDEGDYMFIGMAVAASGWYLFWAYFPLVGATQFITSALDLPSGTTKTYSQTSAVNFSKAIFRTEADVFYCFTANEYNRLYYLRDDMGGSYPTYGYVDLPFYPQSIVSHANRIFSIDTNNKLWWSRAGDLFSWYSAEYDDDRLLGTSNMKNGAFTLTGTIDAPRVATITCHTVGGEDTRGIITLVGTNALGNPLTAVVTLPSGDGSRVQTPEVFATISTATQSGWTINGTADTIEIGVGPVGSGYVVDDAGMWTVDTERKIDEIFVISNVLYVSGGKSIYAFRGYDYSTFNLQRLFSDFGNPKKQNFGYSSVVSARGKAYFISNYDIYEFNGDSIPRPINKPQYVNGALTNGMMGGSAEFNEALWTLEATEDYLYVYQRPNYSGGGSFDPSYYYAFHFETRTWWKKSGFSKLNYPTLASTDKLFMRIVPLQDNTDFWTFLWTNDGGTTEDDFWFSPEPKSHGVTQGEAYPYVVTKSYQSLPSEHGTLTDVLLAMQATDGLTADIQLFYSLSEKATDDFQLIGERLSYRFTNDMEILRFPVHPSFVANAHHYRLKIVVSNHRYGAMSGESIPVYLYNIERRFRVRGYSR